ncbi:MAG: DUF2065 domain-containing protein [Betaproteobacteria bacterium]|nr:MAG: DUF2065 domain-containing protein [Betaproteobacteria bacterium]
MQDILLPALALMLIMEGVMPFLAPTVWRETFTRLATLRLGQIRFMGLISMVLGVAMLQVAL